MGYLIVSATLVVAAIPNIANRSAVMWRYGDQSKQAGFDGLERLRAATFSDVTSFATHARTFARIAIIMEFSNEA